MSGTVYTYKLFTIVTNNNDVSLTTEFDFWIILWSFKTREGVRILETNERGVKSDHQRLLFTHVKSEYQSREMMLCHDSYYICSGIVLVVSF